jgi:signal transduction histidine kinase
MCERARQLGGSVLIESAPGAGFRIAVHMPVSVLQTSAPGIR